MKYTQREYPKTLAEEDLPSLLEKLSGDEKYLYCTIEWKSYIEDDLYDEEEKEVVIQLTDELSFEDEIFYTCKRGIEEIKELVSIKNSKQDFFIDRIKKFTKNLE